MKIYLVTYNETEQRDSKGNYMGTLCTPITMVSHGIDEDMNTVILPVEPLSYFIRTCQAQMDNNVGMYYI